MFTFHDNITLFSINTDIFQIEDMRDDITTDVAKSNILLLLIKKSMKK